jgi:peroxiredoxin|tara:strand:- start:40515 stop:41021 length:507 start_codon:yes stop_codon:yes gene_type:complete
MLYEGDAVPAVVFNIRKDGEFTSKSSYDLFSNKRVVLFALPGAFTPTCSTEQLPGFEKLYEDMMDYVDEVYCLSVNDSFVMNAWAESLGIKNVKMIPDGSCDFTYSMGMAVAKDNLGFGIRSWRYAAVIENGLLEKMLEEEGQEDDHPADPFEASSAESVLEYLRTNS